MLPSTRFWILIPVLLAFVIGCGDEAARPTGGDGKPMGNAAAPVAIDAEAGFAVGRVTMADGSAVSTPGADVTISIQGTTEVGARVSYSPPVKPDGTYRQKLAAGSYTFSFCTIEVPFEGKQYIFSLEPVGNLYKKDRDSGEGIVQDFVWKLTGPKLGGDGDVNNHTQWYGGSIGVRFGGWRNDINKAAPDLPDGTPITFTLKPTTKKCVDGSDAKVVTIERKYSARWKNCDALNNIPVAHYEMTGVATLADGTRKPLLFEVKYAKYEPVMPINFAPDPVMRNVVKPLTGWVTE